jgi:hypothetical protein
VGIVVRLWAGQPANLVPRRGTTLFFFKPIHPYVKVVLKFFPWGKVFGTWIWPISYPSSNKFKDVWSYTYTLQNIFMSWCRVLNESIWPYFYIYVFL